MCLTGIDRVMESLTIAVTSGWYPSVSCCGYLLILGRHMFCTNFSVSQMFGLLVCIGLTVFCSSGEQDAG